MSEGLIAGFERRRLPGEGLMIDALVGGNGPPLLLLHGFPQTRLCWRKPAIKLAKHFTVVVPDLRGYGRSDKPSDRGEHTTYSKREMANDQLRTMAALGYEKFGVAGHDRGGRVAYRLALDHPSTVTRLAVIDILPTADVWEATNALTSMLMWHWSFLAQPDGLPEKLIGSDPKAFLEWLFVHQAPGFAFDDEDMADYLSCGSDPAAVHAMCEDYRAGWSTDQTLDLADRDQRKIACPTLALWGERGLVARSEPEQRWRRWTDDLAVKGLPSGHFVPEEASDETANELLAFFAPG